MTPKSGPGPDRTPDGRYIIVGGRRWRVSDPAIPEALRAELVAVLMAARRLVSTDPTVARPRVHDAKVALGERGDPWWAPTEVGRRIRLAAAIRSLLRHRNGKSICPSEAARIVGGKDWRNVMPIAREVADELSVQSVVRVQQHGVDVDIETAIGAIRLGPGPALG